MFSTIRGNRFALLFILHFILAQFLVLLIMNIFPSFDRLLPSIGLTQIALVFMPILYYLFYTKSPVKKTLKLHRIKLSNLFLSALLGVLIIPVVMLINLISQFFVKSSTTEILGDIGKESFLFSLLVIAVFPAIFEELVSRGILISNYRNSKLFITCSISGLFFGMMHLNINQFLYAFVLGFIFSFVVHITGSIFSSMIMHFVVNGLNLSLAYLASSDTFASVVDADMVQEAMEIPYTQQLLTAIPGVIFMIIVTIPFVAIVAFFLISSNNKLDLIMKNAPSKEFFPQEEDPDSNIISLDAVKEPILTFSLFASVGIFLLMSILNELL